jgi:alkylation response protein AidB-like acyl-CoA dehydrogenase
VLIEVLAPLLPDIGRRHLAAPDAYPASSIEVLQQAGALAAPFPKALGGRAASLLEMVEAVRAIAAVCPSTALLVSMPMGLAGALSGGAEVAPDMHEKTAAEQLERVAADYGAGALYAACNSEKGLGGSLAATKTVAKRTPAGFALQGEKILASFGTKADVFFSTAKIDPSDLAGAGVVEFFFVDTKAPGVVVLDDWNGHGMRGTESHSVRYEGAIAREVTGFPDFIAIVRPLQYWFCLFAAIPLGCANAAIRALGTPSSPVLRSRVADFLMRYEALAAYLRETAAMWRPAADAAFGARVLRTKTFVSHEATRLCADAFALSGGRHYVRGGALAGALSDSFAGTALRPPLPLALDQLAESLSLDPLDG